MYMITNGSVKGEICKQTILKGKTHFSLLYFSCCSGPDDNRGESQKIGWIGRYCRALESNLTFNF